MERRFVLNKAATIVKAPFLMTLLSLVRKSSAMTACRALTSKFVRFCFAAVAAATPAPATELMLQKSGRPLLALTQGALLSGKILEATLNTPRERNIWSSIFFWTFCFEEENCESSEKAAFEKIDRKGLPTEAVPRQAPTSLA